MTDRGLFIRVQFRGGSDAMSILAALQTSGWRPDDDGLLLYLPVGDTDFDWRETPVSNLATVMQHFQTKAQAGEVIGVFLAFEDTAVGGEWLFFPDGTVILTPSVNRKTTSYGSDVGWYLHRVLPALQNARDFAIESWRWEEIL